MEQTIEEKLRQRQRQILVHSYLYYVQDLAYIEDHKYDAWFKELVELQNRHPEIAAASTYWEICKDFDESGSAYHIGFHEYPPKIISTAAHLYHYNHKDKMSFQEVLDFMGLQIIEEKKATKIRRPKVE